MHHVLDRRRWAAGALAALAAVASLSACTGGSSTPPEQQAAQRFLSAVAAGSASAAAAQTSAPTTSRPELQASLTGIGLGRTGAKATFTPTRKHTKGSHSTVDYSAAITLAGAPAWRYTGHVALARTGSSWRVQWSPADLNPQLGPGTHLLAQRVQPARAALEDSAGKALFAPTPVVAVGIEPKLVKNLPKLASTLAAVPQLQSTAAEITSAVKAAAHPTDFVPVITLRRSVYEQVRSKIYNLDGTVFRTEHRVADAERALRPAVARRGGAGDGRHRREVPRPDRGRRPDRRRWPAAGLRPAARRAHPASPWSPPTRRHADTAHSPS